LKRDAASARDLTALLNAADPKAWLAQRHLWLIRRLATLGAPSVGVSFFVAFRVALRSREIRLADRSRIHRAIRARLWGKPLSFPLPLA
jgi:site-specific recombinase